MDLTNKMNDTSIISCLQENAESKANELAFTFLGKQEETLTNAELFESVKVLASKLVTITELGEPVLLLCPPGLAYVRAFYACLVSGRVAVPLYPPRLKQRTDRISKVVENVDAKIAITSDDLFEPLQQYLADSDELAGGQLMSIAKVLELPESGDISSVSNESIAFIQYTSGSTGTPKGVMVSHNNIMANLIALKEVSGACKEDVFVNWLPLFHDLGLVNTMLLPVFLGAHSVLMNPAAFVQKPLTWLSAIERFKGTICGAPNFAYDVCASKIADEKLVDLDLSSWKIAFNAAEPINPQTLETFYQKFKGCGFNFDAFYPSYGMAEATVFLTAGKRNGKPVIGCFDKEELGQRRVKAVSIDGQQLVGCGAMPSGHQLSIVDPQTLATVQEGSIGEIWVNGPSIAKGYLGLDERTKESFHAFTDQNEGPYLRTGDLGFVHEGELFISGRIKDIMIIRGRNYYPQDIEQTVNGCHDDLVKNHAAAFSLDIDGNTELFLVQEVKPKALKKIDSQQVIEHIRRAIALEFDLKTNVVLIRPGTLPKTSSGKVQRSKAKLYYVDKQLSVVEVTQRHDKQSVADFDVTETEFDLISFWKEVLRVDQVKPTSDFFALGGDSLDATKLLAKIEGEYGFSPSLEALYSYPTVNELARYVDEQVAVLDKNLNERTIVAANSTVAPLSFSQQRMWFINQIEAQRTTLNLPVALRLKGDLDLNRLHGAFKKVIERHAIMRTSYPWRNDSAIQTINDLPENVLQFDDLSEHPNAEKIVQEMIDKESKQQFNLEEGPVYSICLFELSDKEHLLSFVVHHIAADAWSMDIFIRELGELYRDPNTKLTNSSINYTDYARWQTEHHDRKRADDLVNYWQENLKSAPTLLSLPYDKSRPARQTFSGGTVKTTIADDILAQLQRFSVEQKTTLFVTLLSAFQVQLQRLSGQSDLVIGTDVAGRNHSQTSDLVGFFVNQLVLRQNLGETSSFSHLVNRNTQMVLDAMSYQDMPFERIVDEICTTRDPSYSPVFQVKFLLNQSPLHNLSLENIGVTPVEQQETRSQYDLTLSADRNNDGGFDLNFHYNSDLFDKDTVEVFLTDYLDILEQVATDTSKQLNTLALQSTRNQSYQLAQSGRKTTVRCASSLYLDVHEQMKQSGNKVAVVFGENKLSYSELNQSVDQLCNFLTDIEIGQNSLVGVHLSRSLPQIVTILAIAKMGATLLPLDPDYPTERITFMLNDSAPDIVITEDAEHEHLSDFYGVSIELDNELSLIADEDEYFSMVGIEGISTAYRIYTSGSTGNPKGVDVAYSSLSNLCDWYIDFSDISNESVVLQPIPLGFDASIKNIFSPLMAGGTLVLAPVGGFDPTLINHQVAQNEVTLINCVPSMFLAMLETSAAENYQAIQSLKMVALGGEATELSRLKDWLKSSNCHSQLANIYGPTECTDISVAYKTTNNLAADLEHMPVGYAIDNATTYLVDENLCLVPDGVAGELVVAGAGVSQGYYNRSDLNQISFVDDMFSGQGKMYRTGDLMRRNKQGVLEYLGRKDDQVKVNGVRIETGEITSRLCMLDAIADAQVLLIDNRLVAFYQPLGLTPPDERQLREYLVRYLPKNWLPKVFVPVKTMPSLPNGKLDKNTLLELPLPELSTARQIDKPENEVESILVAIWQQVLTTESLGVKDNFFDLGGDSINAVRVVSLAKENALDFSVADVFEHQTIRELSANLNRKTDESEAETDSAFDMLSQEDLDLLGTHE